LRRIPGRVDFDLVPLDRIAGTIDFDPFAGLELAGGDRRLAVLRELAVELLPKVWVRDKRFRSLLPDKLHRVSEAEFEEVSENYVLTVRSFVPSCVGGAQNMRLVIHLNNRETVPISRQQS